jgi:GTP-binding protein
MISKKCEEILSVTDYFPLEFKEKAKTKIYNAYEENKEIFKIKKEKDHVFRIYGESIERTYGLINISTDEGLMRLINYLRKIKVEEELQKMGAVSGDSVFLCDFEFEYLE